MSKRIRQKAVVALLERRLRGKLLLSRVASFSCYQLNSKDKTCTSAIPQL